LLLVLAVGCKTPPPNLKPPIGPQELNLPPHVERYDDAKWPDACLADPNPKKPGTKDNKDDGFKNAGGPNLGMSPSSGMQTGGFR
jgi:hypothetical protein